MHFFFALFTTIFLTSFTLSNPALAQVQAQNAVYLDTSKSSSPLIKYFLSTFQGTVPTAAVIKQVIKVGGSDKVYENLRIRYHEDLHKMLNIGAGKKYDEIDDWNRANPQVAKGVALYVESPLKGDPVWQGLNKKLRTNQPLSPAEKKALNQILTALDKIPVIRGIAFRGAGIKPEYLKKYVKGAIVNEPSFVSASVGTDVAEQYGDVSGPTDINGRPTAGKVSTTFVIKIKTSYPVTAFSPNYYFEYEMLMKPGNNFKVHHSLYSPGSKKAYIILEQL